jgi:hypothetical protein
MAVMVEELYEALRLAGVQDGAAKTAARAVLGADARHDLATKTDVADLRADVADLKADLAGLRIATKGDLAEVRALMKADLLDMKADLLKWHVGTLLAITAIYGGLVSLLKLFG